jgi:ABC-2 type transport system permease protein
MLLLVCLFGPFAFALILNQQSGAPADTLLGVWVHSSGYAVSLVVLGFAGSWGFPLLAAVLAGDLFSSEDRHSTWKTVLTRSRSRAEVFIGKVLVVATFSIALVAAAAISSVAAGLLLTGDQPLVGLSGTVIGSGECLLLVLASWLLSVLPVLAFMSLAVLFSVATRSGMIGVLGPVLVALVMQLLALIGGGTWIHMLLVSSAFDDWHGLLTADRFYGPLIIGSLVSVVWALVCLSVAWQLLRRRDFAGTAVGRRGGWGTPVRVALGAAAVIVLLAAAGNWGATAVTKGRLEASMGPAFSRLTRLQQEELGQSIPQGAELTSTTNCQRRAGASKGPGDDWSCTFNVFAPQTGYNPLKVTQVVYDLSVKSNGCYKAQASPAFVGRQMMADEHGHSVVNPLFTIYGCFDTTATSRNCADAAKCSAARTHPTTTRTTPATTSTSNGGSPARTAAEAVEAKRAADALREAERRAGPKVMREVTKAEQQLKRAAEHPEERAANSATEPARGAKARK